jgi:hypothetical protein
MLRIVGIQRSDCAEVEFLLLQNQGTLRVSLRGHVVLAETAIERGELARAAHLFADDEHVPAGLYVMLSTAQGMPHWGRTKDGAHVYHAYAGRTDPLWSEPGPLHILAPGHTYCERLEPMLLR